MELGILDKFVYPEVPPHVEYRLTALGDRMLPIIDAIEQLQNELNYESQQ
ncbi:MAG: winged helix-turn-helix transcriptional regulator [Cyanobacteria bacterium J06635_13]